MPKNKKNQGTSLGKSIINAKNKKNNPESKHHTTEINEEPKFKSVIDQNSLNEYLQLAELENKKYEALRETKIKTEHVVIDMNTLLGLNQKPQIDEKDVILRIPRRPKWNSSTSPEELTLLENKSFLTWRKELAKYEEELLINKTFTPFEKNLEIWKQLWRVIEKSDILVQIVDGRNPWFFRCSDLEVYVKEVDPNKENILLINKSDLLSEDIRKCWNEYFLKFKINHVFFSAKKEQEKIDQIGDNDQHINKEIIKPDQNQNNNQENVEIPNKQKQEDNQKQEDKQKQEDNQKQEENQNVEIKENSHHIFNRENLMTILKNMAQEVRKKKINLQHKSENEELKSESHPNENSITIGFVGYPNVGKSSVMNVLCQKKKVGVAAQPGKTKHFQTIIIEKDLILCDCPGLVYPNMTSTRAEMVCNGVLPIDQLKDYLSPIQFLGERIPKYVFEAIYHIRIDFPKPSASQILQALGQQRGYLTGRGIPDEAKCAKMILKDFVSGKLIWCCLPPDYDPNNSNKQINQTNNIDLEELKKNLVEKKFDEDLENDKLAVLEEFKQNYEKQFFDNQTEKITLEDLDVEDIDALQQGKTVKGIKLTKQQRREIKFALQRGDPIDIKEYIGGGNASSGAKSLGKFADPNFSKAKIPIYASKE